MSCALSVLGTSTVLTLRRNYDPNPTPFLRAARTVEGKTQLLPYPAANEAPTPVYDGLRTNLAGGIMQFRGFPFPDSAHLFPTSEQVLAYLQSYAEAKDLLPHIRFSTRVERLRLTPTSGARRGGRRWGITSSNTATGTSTSEEFDYVAVANGHYADGYIPPIDGLSEFPGTILHSREFRKEAEYAGKKVLVVGSFASGSDVSRLIAQLNVGHYDAAGAALHDGEKLPFTPVYQSSSGVPNINNGLQDGSEPWKPFVENVPLIERVEGPSASFPKGRVWFYEEGAETDNGIARGSHAPLDDVDVIIFATGYYNALPFIKGADAPWSELRPLEDEITKEERAGGAEWEIGGLRGWAVRGLDPLLLFLENDRTIIFNVLREFMAWRQTLTPRIPDRAVSFCGGTRPPRSAPVGGATAQLPRRAVAAAKPRQSLRRATGACGGRRRSRLVSANAGPVRVGTVPRLVKSVHAVGGGGRAGTSDRVQGRAAAPHAP